MLEKTGTQNRGLFWIFLVLLVTAVAWYLYAHQPISTSTDTTVETDIPFVMRTPGGLLEVATINANEYFKRSNPKTLPLIIWDIDLGETVSEIHVPAVYRYHIELAPEWKIMIRGKTYIVKAPPIKSSLPVAIDTTKISKRTENGWARFNKAQNLDVLERSISTKLATKSDSSRYLQLVTPYARETVKEFVTKWLIKQQDLKRYPVDQVIVLFPGESVK